MPGRASQSLEMEKVLGVPAQANSTQVHRILPGDSKVAFVPPLHKAEEAGGRRHEVDGRAL